MSNATPIYLDAQSVAARLSGLPALCNVVSFLAPLTPPALASVAACSSARFAALAEELVDQADYLQVLSAKLAEMAGRLKP